MQISGLGYASGGNSSFRTGFEEALEKPTRHQSDRHTADTSTSQRAPVSFQLSPEASKALADGGFDNGSSMTTTNSIVLGGGENPDGTVTTVGEVVVVGQRQTLFTVSITLPEPPPYVPIHEELGPDRGDLPAPPELTPCQRETIKDRAALEAQKILAGLDKNKEWGMYLIQDPDGSVRGVGPIAGNHTTLQWNATVAELGITSWDQLVGLVHTHPKDTPGDTDAYRFSPEDRNVTNTFVSNGANTAFRQYISVDGQLFQFSKTASAGSTSSDNVSGQGCP